MPSPVAFSQASLRVQRLKKAAVLCSLGRLLNREHSVDEKKRATSSLQSGSSLSSSTSTPIKPARVIAINSRSFERATLKYKGGAPAGFESAGFPFGP